MQQVPFTKPRECTAACWTCATRTSLDRLDCQDRSSGNHWLSEPVPIWWLAGICSVAMGKTNHRRDCHAFRVPVEEFDSDLLLWKKPRPPADAGQSLLCKLFVVVSHLRPRSSLLLIISHPHNKKSYQHQLIFLRSFLNAALVYTQYMSRKRSVYLGQTELFQDWKKSSHCMGSSAPQYQPEAPRLEQEDISKFPLQAFASDQHRLKVLVILGRCHFVNVNVFRFKKGKKGSAKNGPDFQTFLIGQSIEWLSLFLRLISFLSS